MHVQITIFACSKQFFSHAQSMLNSDFACSDNLCVLKTNFECSSDKFMHAQSDSCLLKVNLNCMLNTRTKFSMACICMLNTRTKFTTARICMLNTWTKFSTAHICMPNTWTKFSMARICMLNTRTKFSTARICMLNTSAPIIVCSTAKGGHCGNYCIINGNYCMFNNNFCMLTAADFASSAVIIARTARCWDVIIAPLTRS